MIDKFDNLVKSAIEGLEEVPNVRFQEERVWKQIEKKLSNPIGDLPYYIMLICDIIGSGLLLCVLLFNTTQTTVSAEVPRTFEKGKVFQKEVVVDTIITLKTAESIKNHSRTKSNKHIDKMPRDTKKVTVFASQPIVELASENSFQYAMPEKGEFAVANEKMTFTKTTIHVYRPRRYVGSGLVFKLRANGILINKVRNGAHSILELDSGTTQLLIGRQKLDMNLKPNETYYLRVRYVGFPIGKPKLEWIAKEFAEKELLRLKTIKKE